MLSNLFNFFNDALTLKDAIALIQGMDSIAKVAHPSYLKDPASQQALLDAIAAIIKQNANI
jgi:hypothetical protein